MFADVLNASYDSYDPKDALDLVGALRSYISVKLDHEKKTSEFITDLRQSLYLIHKYNCRVAKVTNQYPRVKKLELLLIKYVELEFDLLYHGNQHPPRDIEAAVELQVLRLLQMMLYPAVLNNKSVVNKNADRVVTEAVLQILGEVSSAYMVENRLVCNIANKLLKTINGSKERKLLDSESKNVVTSDYGSDDSDTDFDTKIFSDPVLQRRNVPDSIKRTSSSDCVEVVPTSNGLAPIPTFEFSDDDDICYFIYLQRQKPTKRKLDENDKTICETIKNEDTQNVTSTINLNSNKESTQSVPSCSDESNESCVIVCSDSEDEGSKSSNKKPETKNEKNKKSDQKKKSQSPVVTFEILDDDDDDDENSYMVYLHKEVKTNKKSKKPKERRIEEVIICSDSEDESVEKPNTSQESLNKEKCPSDGPEFASNSGDEFTPQEENTANETARLINLFSTDNNCSSQNTNLINISNCDETLNSEIDTICHEMQIEPIASTSAQVDPVFFLCNEEIPATIQEDYNSNLLVDPAVILEQVINMKKDDEVIEKFNSSNSSQMDAVSTEIDTGGNILSPITDEKVEELDLAYTSECRINESLLEEILLDDNYKEFEELEYFLFNDTIGKQGFSLSNLSWDDNEALPQPETFHADIQSLESYINDSNLIDVTEGHYGTALGASEITFGNNEFTDIGHDDLKLDFTFRRLTPQRQVKNTTYTESWKRKRKHSRVKDLRTIFDQYKKVNKR